MEVLYFCKVSIFPDHRRIKAHFFYFYCFPNSPCDPRFSNYLLSGFDKVQMAHASSSAYLACYER